MGETTRFLHLDNTSSVFANTCANTCLRGSEQTAIPGCLDPLKENPVICFATVDRLNAEWRHLSTSPESTQHLHRWTNRCPELTEATDMTSVLTSISESPDPVLSFLIRVGQDLGDELALRTVVQSMLRGLLNRCGGPAEYTDAVSHLWETVRTYPLDRRPRSIAANVLLDTVKRTRRQLSETNSVDSDLTVGHYEFDPASRFGGIEWTAGRLLRAAVELQLLPACAMELLQAITRAGPTQTLKEISAEMGVSPATNRQRYHRLVALLRERQDELFDHETDLFCRAA